MTFRLRMQLAEILGHDNRWYCAQFYGRRIDDPDTLAEHFCKNGGAADFARRYDEAMGEDNRWFCAQFYGREITDVVILWRYYMTYRNVRTHPASRSREDKLQPC